MFSYDFIVVETPEIKTRFNEGISSEHSLINAGDNGTAVFVSAQIILAPQ